MSVFAGQQLHEPQIGAFKIRVNASRGQKGSKGHRGKRLPAPNDLRGSVEELKLAKERHRLKRARERDQLEGGSASNWEFLQALDEKECMLEIQTMMLGTLAAEENKLNDCKTELNPELFTGRMQDVVEAISTLKY